MKVLALLLAYLTNEVPRWERENHCFSCHNNGDGARALYLAQRKGQPVPPAALETTTAWLRRPDQWAAGKSTAGSADKNLARVQFAAALAEAYRARAVDLAALRAAADLLIANQSPDGSWPVDTGSLPGAPATYGTALATYLARDVLRTANAPTDRATRWLATAKPANVPDAAALLLADPRREDCRTFLLRSHNPDGGWGPQPSSPSEPFDTALAVLALRDQHGRAWLLRTQSPDGAWSETTRPAGAVSYAERISTAAWVAQALLEMPR
jgi:hypothetical protein